MTQDEPNKPKEWHEVQELLPLQIAVGIMPDGRRAVVLHARIGGKLYGLPLRPEQARKFAAAIAGMAAYFETAEAAPGAGDQAAESYAARARAALLN